MSLNLLSRTIIYEWQDGKLVKVSDTGWKGNPDLCKHVEELEEALCGGAEE